MRWRVFIGNKAVDTADVDWSLTDIGENPRCISGQLQIRSTGDDNLSELLQNAWDQPQYIHIQAIGDDDTIWPVLDLEDVEFTSLHITDRIVDGYPPYWDCDLYGYMYSPFTDLSYGELPLDQHCTYEIDFIGYEID